MGSGGVARPIGTAFKHGVASRSLAQSVAFSMPDSVSIPPRMKKTHCTMLSGTCKEEAFEVSNSPSRSDFFIVRDRGRVPSCSICPMASSSIFRHPVRKGIALDIAGDHRLFPFRYHVWWKAESGEQIAARGLR